MIAATTDPNLMVHSLSDTGLLLTFVPVAGVIVVLYRWRTSAKSAVYATFRMLVQLLAIGYALIYIFDSDRIAIIALVLCIMLGVWPAGSPFGRSRRRVPDLLLVIDRHRRAQPGGTRPGDPGHNCYRAVVCATLPELMQPYCLARARLNPSRSISRAR
ncbi:MAG: ABC transporter permease [Pseudomonadales bacterium]|nr:ABC transporter permease [Pseudomonadales bacterium]MDP6472777.1 ABC transporter permease [Pseudomonadales bacterium]MDP6827990.1 ABC transporter permease [Pseudomonadales bacterium]MDP6972889.1 ABC transporter permease [Pseudomonadales bacterium]